MRRLLLVRHGAAAAQAAKGEDHERPLSAEGRRALGLLAPKLAAFGPPESILCSPSRRTRETLEILTHALGWSIPPSLEDQLYPGEYLSLLHSLRGLDPSLERVLVVAHNPGIGELVGRLSGNAPELREFRPGSAALFEIATPWFELEREPAVLLAFYPS